MALALLPQMAAHAQEQTADPCEGAPQATFSDRGEIPPVHQPNVDCAAHLDIVSGFADGTFRPALEVRRDQMASFIALTLDAAGVTLPAGQANTFTDVPAGGVHTDNINRLAAAGIVQGGALGLPATQYGPALRTRRDQMASFLMRAAGFALHDDVNHFDSTDQAFTDVPPGNTHFAKVNAAAENDITQGVGGNQFAPDRETRRDQMATFVIRLLRFITDDGTVDPGDPQVNIALSDSSGPAGTTVTGTLTGDVDEVASIAVAGDCVENGDVTLTNGTFSVDIADDAAPGACTLTFTVTFDDGTTQTITSTFTVDDPDAPAISVALSPIEGETGTTVTATVSGDVGELDTLAIAGDCVTDGNVTVDASNQFTFDVTGEVGACDITFTATFDDGSTLTRTATFAIIEELVEFPGSDAVSLVLEPKLSVQTALQQPGFTQVNDEDADTVNPVDEDHTVTATLLDADGNVTDGAVRFEVFSKGNHDAPNVWGHRAGTGQVTETDGEETFTFNSGITQLGLAPRHDASLADTQVVVACVVEDNQTPCGDFDDPLLPPGGQDAVIIDPVTGEIRNLAEEPNDAAYKRWEWRVADELTLSADFTANFTHLLHDLQIDVVDQFGDALDDAEVFVNVLRFDEDGTFVAQERHNLVTSDGSVAVDYLDVDGVLPLHGHEDVIVACAPLTGEDDCAEWNPTTEQIDRTDSEIIAELDKSWLDLAEVNRVELDLSWMNEVSPFGAVEDLAARYGSDGVVTMWWSAEHGLVYTEGDVFVTSEIPADGTPAGSNFHLHQGALDENGPVVASLITPQFQQALGSGETDVNEVAFGDFETFAAEGPYHYSLDGQVQDEDFVSALEALDSALSGAANEDLLDFYLNVHTVDDPAGEVRGQIRAPDPTTGVFSPIASDGGQSELPPIYKQVDDGPVELRDSDNNPCSDAAEPDCAPLQVLELTFTEAVRNPHLFLTVDELSRHEFDVTVNGEDVAVGIDPDWLAGSDVQELLIDRVVNLNDEVVVTISDAAAEKIFEAGVAPPDADDLTESVLTRSFVVGQDLTGENLFGEIAGVVTDADTGAPIAGATVTATNGSTVSTQTDDSGAYSVRVLAGDDYTVDASAMGYEPADTVVDVEVNALETTTVNFALVSVEASVSGKVTDSATGDPIPGATVTISEDDGAPGAPVAGALIGTANTNSAGDYTIPLDPGDYGDVVFQVQAAGFDDLAVQEADFQLAPGENVVRNFALDADAGGMVTGTVTVDQLGGPRHGDPVVGADVALVNDDTGLPVDADLTAVDGTYTVTALDPGTYRVEITKTGYTDFVSGTFPLSSVNAPTATVDAGLVPDVTVTDAVFTPGSVGSTTFGDNIGDTLTLTFTDDLAAFVDQNVTAIAVTLDGGNVISCDAPGTGVDCAIVGNQLIMEVTAPAGVTDVESMFIRQVEAVDDLLDLNLNLVVDPAVPVDVT